MISIFKKLKLKANIRKLIYDFGYSILASLISAGVMQIFVYPMLAKAVDSIAYGVLLTAMGIVNTLSVSLGNTLNNTRLIQNTKYSEANLCGDFNILLVIVNILGFISITLIGNIIFDFSFQVNILLAVLVVLIILKSYFVVAYRLTLNFKLNFLCNVITSIGYIIGVILAINTGIWPLVFIIGEAFCITFVFFTVDLYKEPYKITILLCETFSQYSILVMTSLFGNILIYMDRLIIYPVLGAKFVSVYTVASFFGKSFGIVMTPIAGVLLGYYAQRNFEMTLKKFWRINMITLIASIVFSLFAWLISPWFTGLLYPTLIENAQPYIFLANISAIIAVVANMTQPAVLKFAPLFWQIVKEMIYGVIYLGLGYVLLNRYGLYGFCIASIFANSIRLIILYLIGTIYIRRK